ncbi:MAG: hypothetical protein AAF497_04425 [Planctomycetota bacterium]
MTKRRLQISMRLLLVTTTLICVYLGLYVKFRPQREAVKAIKELGGKVEYHPFYFGFVPRIGTLGDVECVDMSRCSVTDQHIELLPRFKRLRRLYLARARVQDKHLETVGQLTNLERLALWGNRMSADSLKSLVPLQQLRLIDVHDNRRMNGQSFVALSKLKSLERIIIGQVIVSDYHLRHLGKMPRVKVVGELWIKGATQEGIDALAKLNPCNYQVTRIFNCTAEPDAFLALALDEDDLPFGPKLYIENTKLSEEVLARFPWMELTDVRIKETGLGFDQLMDAVPVPLTAVLASSQLGLAQDWDWESSRGWAPIGLSLWTDISPSSLTKEQAARLPDVEGIRVDSKEPLGDFLTHFQEHEKLRILINGYVPPETPIVEQIGKLQSLERLRINFCNPRTRMSIRPLGQLKQLKRLEFYCTPFGDEEMDVLADITSLEDLTLMAAHTVEGPGLEHLLKLKNLKKVKIRSRRDWNASFETVVELKQHVERLTLIDVRLSPENLDRYKAIEGARYLDW